MSDNWKQAYSRLKGHIASNPRIKITRNVVAIPADLREEFYRLFDEIRLNFIKEKTPTIYDEAGQLVENYHRAAREVQEQLALEKVEVPGMLAWFFSDPAKGLSRALFDLTFDLLKDKINLETYEFEAAEAVGEMAGQLFKAGYEKWLMLAILSLLDPDEPRAISVEEINDKCIELEDDEKRGFFEENVPRLRDIKVLHLGHEGHQTSFVVANAVVHSPELGRYVSMGSDFTDAGWSAKNRTDKREWIKLRELGRDIWRILEWPSLAIYMDEKPDNIGLIADYSRFLRPEIIIESREQIGWYKRNGLERVKNHYDFFNPRLGSIIISRYPVPESVLEELNPEPAAPGSEPQGEAEPAGVSELSAEPAATPEPARNIQIITARYDKSLLAPVVETLSASLKPQEPGSQEGAGTA